MRGYTRRECLIILALALGSFTGVLNVYLLTPFLKLVAGEFGVSQSAVGQLSTVYALTAGLIGLLVAPLTDRYQRRLLLQLGLAVVALGTILSALAWSFPVLIAARALAGLGAAIIGGSSFAAVSDAFPDAGRRNRVIGLLLSVGGIAAVIGIPILTQIASVSGWRVAAAALLPPLAVAVAGVAVLPARDLSGRPPLIADYLARYRRVLHHRETSYLLLANVVRSVIWTVPLVYSVAIWIGRFHMSLRSYGWLYFGGGAVYFAASNLGPALVRRFSARGVFIAGTVLQLAAALAFGLASGSLPVEIALYWGIFAFAGSLMGVALNILLQDSLPEVRGAVLSLGTTAMQAGSALGGILGGLVLADVSSVALLPAVSLLTPLALVAIWRSARAYAAAPAAPALAGD